VEEGQTHHDGFKILENKAVENFEKITAEMSQS